MVMTSAWAVAQDAIDPSAELAAASYRWPFAFEEQEPVVAASPAAKVSFELPAGTSFAITRRLRSATRPS
jgi:hypothetical protein